MKRGRARNPYYKRKYVRRGAQIGKPTIRRYRAISNGYSRRVGTYGRYQGTGGSEYKYLDTTQTLTAVAAAGSILKSTICILPQGTGPSQRLGRKVTLKTIHFKGCIKMANTTLAPATADMLRVIIYQDTQCNGTAATIATTADGLLQSADIFSFRNMENTGRYRFLYDKVRSIASMSGAYDGTNDQFGENFASLRFNIKCNIPLEYSATTGVLTELRSNNVGLAAISQDGVVQIEGNFRIRYSDM